jgi:hypothetical protein
MQDFPKQRMVAGEKLGTIGGSDLEHGSIPFAAGPRK